MAKIVGGVAATNMPVPDWNQTNPLRADYIKNKPNVITQEQYDADMGDVSTALDSILAMQEALIGGGA